MYFDQGLNVVLLVVSTLLLMCYIKKSSKCGKNEYFSLSKKPMETEGNLLNRNPFDDIDYITPTFTMYNKY
jgi:hypothetical protein